MASNCMIRFFSFIICSCAKTARFEIVSNGCEATCIQDAVSVLPFFYSVPDIPLIPFVHLIRYVSCSSLELYLAGHSPSVHVNASASHRRTHRSQRVFANIFMNLYVCVCRVWGFSYGDCPWQMYHRRGMEYLTCVCVCTYVLNVGGTHKFIPRLTLHVNRRQHHIHAHIYFLPDPDTHTYIIHLVCQLTLLLKL